jgi:hypothetical protein
MKIKIQLYLHTLPQAMLDIIYTKTESKFVDCNINENTRRLKLEQILCDLINENVRRRRLYGD